MGYEVVNADGSAERTSIRTGAGVGAPGEAIDLTQPGNDDVRRGPSRPRRAWPPVGTRASAALIALLLAVGAVTGGIWGRYRASVVQDVRSRATVVATAITAGRNFDKTVDGFRMAYRVRVDNLGTGPLRLVTTPSLKRPTSAHPMITLLGGEETVQPGKHSFVEVKFELACSSSAPATGSPGPGRRGTFELAAGPRPSAGHAHRPGG